MRYSILFLIGIIFYFIVTIEYFKIGGQKLITPYNPKQSWKNPGPIYYRISDGSCRLGLLADQYKNPDGDQDPDIKNILNMTKLTSKEYGGEVGDRGHFFIKRAHRNRRSSTSLAALAVATLPEHNTYVTSTTRFSGDVDENQVNTLECAKPGGPEMRPLPYKIKCMAPSIYKLHAHGSLMKPISMNTTGTIGKSLFTLDRNHAQLTFPIPKNVTIVSYLNPSTPIFCSFNVDVSQDPTYFCERMKDSYNYLNSRPYGPPRGRVRELEAFGLYTSTGYTLLGGRGESTQYDAPSGRYIELLLTPQEDPKQMHLPNLVKCGNTFPRGGRSYWDIPRESSDKDTASQNDLDVIRTGVKFSTKNLKVGTRHPAGHHPRPGTDHIEWYLSDMVDKVVAIDRQINGNNHPIELHLFTCHTMQLEPKKGEKFYDMKDKIDASMRYHTSTDREKILHWMSNNRQDPRELNALYAQRSIELLDENNETITKERLNNVAQDIRNRCNKCTFSSTDETIDKTNCPDGYVTTVYMDESTDNRKKLLGYNAFEKIQEPDCKLDCNPGYSQTMNSTFNYVTKGKCKHDTTTNKFEGHAGKYQTRWIGKQSPEVNIECERSMINKLCGVVTSGAN